MRRLAASAPWLSIFLLSTPVAQGCHNPLWDGEGMILTEEGPRALYLRVWELCDGPTSLYYGFREGDAWTWAWVWATGTILGAERGACFDPCGFSLGSAGAFRLTHDADEIALDGTWASHGTLLFEAEWSMAGEIRGQPALGGYFGVTGTSSLGAAARLVEDALA